MVVVVGVVVVVGGDSVNVFCDLHHSDLYWSLHALFERRLGWRLFRPIGREWFDAGFWKIAEPYGNPPDTIHQYLGTTAKPWGVGCLNSNPIARDGYFEVADPSHDNFTHRAMTFDQFRDARFDLIVSCYGPSHDVAYDRLRDLYQPQAERLAQMGNVFQKTHCKHVIHSAPYVPEPWQHALYYHQEIDRALFYPTAPDPTTRKITSCVNLLPHREIFDAYKAALPDVEFRAYGASCPDGFLLGAKSVAEKMREANLGWHIKPHDGFGHTAMGWMASGRAVVTRMDEIREYGHDAPRLFVPGETCIPVDGVRAALGRSVRRGLGSSMALGENAARRFDEVCNYAAEEVEIRQFLEGVI